ncbi:MAG: YtzI protein [Solibacillus sp.]
MHIPLSLLMIISLFTVVIITALTLLAIKWGYAYKHTVDVVTQKRGEDK